MWHQYIMPFTSEAQRRKCWVIDNENKKKGKKSTWNCYKWQHDHYLKGIRGVGMSYYGGMTKDILELEMKKLQSKSLSGEELTKLVKGKANLLTYPELTKYNNIDDCLGRHKALILLYETRENYGHWCCLIKHGKNHIEFFDSYGVFPDDEFKWIPEHFRKVSNQVYPHLTWLLYNSGCKIEYNHHKLQSKTKDVGIKIATCGRHVGVRILFRNMPLDMYAKMLKGYAGLTPDMIVTILSYTI